MKTSVKTAAAFAAALALLCAALLTSGNPAKPARPAVEIPEAYRVIVERDIFGFAPRANPQETATATAPVAIPQPAITLPPFNPNPIISAPDTSELYTLTGIIQLGTKFKAIVENRKEGAGHYVAEGETVDGYVVSKILSDRAVLEKDGKQYTLILRSAEKSAEPAPAQSGIPPIQQPPPDYKKLPIQAQPRLGR